MGIDFSSTPALSLFAAPMRALTAWFVPAHGTKRRILQLARAPRKAQQQMMLPFVPDATSEPLDTAIAITVVAGGLCGKITPKFPPRSQLRIVREFDSAISPSCAGRMVISGRMADVCAELERMSQPETQAQ